MASRAKTWLWIVLGFFALCVLSLVVLAGAGFYFVSNHIAMRSMTSADALRTLDTARAQFKTDAPLIEVTPDERAHAVRPIADLPTSSVRPSNLYVLAWDPEKDRLARIALPFWMLRFGHRKIELADGAQDFSFDQLNLNVADLERIGPALLVDFRGTTGQRVLVWTQ
jgi:hypothetical protein